MIYDVIINDYEIIPSAIYFKVNVHVKPILRLRQFLILCVSTSNDSESDCSECNNSFCWSNVQHQQYLHYTQVRIKTIYIIFLFSIYDFSVFLIQWESRIDCSRLQLERPISIKRRTSLSLPCFQITYFEFLIIIINTALVIGGISGNCMVNK